MLESTLILIMEQMGKMRHEGSVNTAHLWD